MITITTITKIKNMATKATVNTIAIINVDNLKTIIATKRLWMTTEQIRQQRAITTTNND